MSSDDLNENGGLPLNANVNIARIIKELQEQELENNESDVSADEDVNVELNPVILDPDLETFSVSTWYKTFKKNMVETIIIDIPTEVVELFSDNDVDILEIQDSQPLNNFLAEADQAISSLGGKAFVKNNWHAPKDASMFSLGHLLQVTSSKDVLSYFRCSEIISTDFDKAISNMKFCLCLRPWIDLHPASEFRCIVVHKKLVGITPREWPKFYEHFKTDGPDIIARIQDFFERNISRFPLNHYIFDVVLMPKKIHLWDFGPLNESTVLQAFIWQEIKSLVDTMPDDCSPTFRYLSQDFGIVPKCTYSQS